MQRGTVANLQARLDQLQRLQGQMSSGRRVSKPSDDPTATAGALRSRADLRRAEQLDRSRKDALGWLQTADSALGSATTSLQRIRDLVVQGGNGSYSAVERDALASEVDSLRGSLLDVANTAYLGRPLFGGTVSGASAYDATGTFVGDTSPVTRALGPGVSVAVNLTGPEVFGTGPTDLFATLTRISNDLRTNPANLSTDLTDLDAGFTRLQNARGQAGARSQRVDAADSRSADDQITLRQRLSDAEDVDLAEIITELGIQQVAYQAALAATQRVIQPSLVDFLR
jgi:flagellar hook-associated protein 3 FlgL